jgi:hypothetical protein
MVDDRPEIESFNLADLDVSAMEVRLELTSVMSACPHVCFENTCPGHGCDVNGNPCAVACGYVSCTHFSGGCQVN